MTLTTSKLDRITLAHGGGGQLTDELVARSILPRLGNDVLNDLLDSAELDLPTNRIAMTIDGYVVTPWRFPGGDIGRIAVCGTVNDLAVTGATPVAIALSLILAEGLPVETLDAVMESASIAAKEAGVRIVTGDTKVVGHGQADGIFIVTAGVGARPARRMHPDLVRPGDAVLINGSIADHGMAVMLARELPQVESAVESDVAPLNGLIHELLMTCEGVVFMRDATRGGLSGLCADLATRTGLGVRLDEASIPIRRETLHIAEMLGIDPLDVANEGKVVVVIRPDEADRALAVMQRHPLGRGAVRIGTVQAEPRGLCTLRTHLGGERILQKPFGEQLARIC